MGKVSFDLISQSNVKGSSGFLALALSLPLSPWGLDSCQLEE